METISVKTAIIGSGVAGISCATNLLRNQYEDLIVLEALDRIGGRVHSIDYNDSFLEIGAQFLHGQQDNPIYYIARDNKQIEEKYNEILDDDENIEDNNGIPIDLDNEDSYVFATQSGHKLDMNLAYEMYNIVNKLVREAKDYYLDTNNNNLKDKSAGEFLYEKYLDLIEAKFVQDTYLKQLVAGFLVWRCKSENIEIGCHTVSDISMRNYCVFKDLAGSQIIELKNGYGKIITFMIEQFKEEFNQKLKLKHELKKIITCTNQSQCQHCSYTTNSNKIVLIINNLVHNTELIILCDNVVCTMSLGYLKENLINLIQPVSLITSEKLLSVQRVGYGTVNKIFLFYDKPFWDSNLSGIQPIWLLDESKGDTILNKLENYNEDNWFESISYFSIVKEHKNILCAWLSGVQFFESFADDKISRECTMVLRTFLANDQIPEPNKIVKSTWFSDPYFKGSYSFLPMGSLGAYDLNKIAEPICIGSDKRAAILFAGEATSQDQFSTVHGAYNTGLRESERILNSTARTNL